MTITSDTLVDVVADDGERFHCTLGAFCRDNADEISHRERVLICQTLAAGQTYRHDFGETGVTWSMAVAEQREMA